MEKEVRFKKINLSIEQRLEMKEKGKPFVRHNGPFTLSGLEEGKIYYYCTCGLSAKEPFCDGAHEKTGFTSVKFKVKNQRVVLLCGCKRNSKEAGVFCDGSHNETCHQQHGYCW